MRKLFGPKPLRRPRGSAPPPPKRPECKVAPGFYEALDLAELTLREHASQCRVRKTARVVLGASVREGGLRNIAAMIREEFPGMSEAEIADATNDQIARRSIEIAQKFESVFEEVVSQSSPAGDEMKEGGSE
jgi:hypothetical protein